MKINPSAEMAKVMKIMEDGYMGKADGSDIDYKTSPKGDKVTATVKGHLSAKYTKLAQNISKIKELQSEIDELTETTKQEARDTIGDLFTAEDEVRTRVVETVSFTLKLTKTPEPTNTVKYAKVLEELEEHLTPELIEVLNDLKSKFTSTVQKAAALSFAPKESVGLEEGPMDKFKGFFTKFLSYIDGWCSKYDAKLDALKAQIGVDESIAEDDSKGDKKAELTDLVHSALSNNGLITVTTVDQGKGMLACTSSDGYEFFIKIIS